MLPVNNQPIKFTETSADLPSCCTDNYYKARMFETDAIEWQFAVDLCPDATELVTDAVFSSGAGWTATNGATFPFPGNCLIPVNADIEQTGISTTAGNWYVLRVVIKSSPIETSQSTLQITGFSQTHEIPTIPGAVEIYVQATSASSAIKLLHNASSGTGFVQITFCGLKEVDYPTCTIRETDGALIESPTTEFNYGRFSTYTYTPSSSAIAIGTFIIRVTRTCGSDTVTYESEPICVIPENDCDLLIGACGNYSGHGDGFLPAIRIKGELMRGTGYTFPDRHTYQDSNGLFRNGYTRRNKQYTLKVDLCPEHVRDFIYATAFSNEIGIREGTADQGFYFLSEEPDEPVFAEREKDLATITLRLTDKDINDKSTFDAECDAALPPVVIGRSDIQEAIETDTDTLIPTTP